MDPGKYLNIPNGEPLTNRLQSDFPKIAGNPEQFQQLIDYIGTYKEFVNLKQKREELQTRIDKLIKDRMELDKSKDEKSQQVNRLRETLEKLSRNKVDSQQLITEHTKLDQIWRSPPIQSR